MYSYGAALPCTTYGGFPSTISYGSGFGSFSAPTYSIAATAYSGGLVSFPAASYPQPTAVSQVPPPIPSLPLSLMPNTLHGVAHRFFLGQHKKTDPADAILATAGRGLFSPQGGGETHNASIHTLGHLETLGLEVRERLELVVLARGEQSGIVWPLLQPVSPHKSNSDAKCVNEFAFNRDVAVLNVHSPAGAAHLGSERMKDS